jgi:type IV pilus assembly protein PilM
MIRFAKSHTYPIGLDLGHDSVKMMQLERIGDRLSVLACARVTLPDDARRDPRERLAAAVDAARTLLKRRGPFSGRRLVAALPRELLQVRNVRVPSTLPDDLSAAVRGELAGGLPFPWDDAVSHCLTAGEVRQGTEPRHEVVLLAAATQEVDHFVEQLRRCGGEITALDAEPLALYRAVDRFVRRQDDRRDVHVLVDVGWERSQVIIGRGWDVQFIKSIDVAGRHFQEAVARKLGVTQEESQSLRRRLNQPLETGTPAEANDPVRQAALDATRSAIEELAQEISLCLRYHAVTFRGQRPTVVKILGGESGDPQLLSVLNRALPIPAQVGRPLYSVDTSRMSEAERRGPMSEWALAFGLALKGVEDRFGPRDGRPREPVSAGEVAGMPVRTEVAHA